MKIGTVRGRHNLPVDRYLIEDAEPGQAAYLAAYTAALQMGAQIDPDGEPVEVYYTGLTEVTLGALDGFRVAGVRICLMRYNAGADAYEQLFRVGDCTADGRAEYAPLVAYSSRLRP